MTAKCQIVSMEGFRMLCKSVSPSITVCVRGRHAIGKSESVYQIAEELGLPVVERRLSQVTEGDVIGLPKLDDGGPEGTKQQSTQFLPCDWLIKACEEPVMLFLDERNRAIEQVKQAVFQLADSKKFYGYQLHPETRILIAENVGDNYQVQQSDPAEISRTVVVQLDPTVEEWLDFAEGKCHQATIEYIRQNKKDLEFAGPFEADKKYPDRRSWFKLDQECQRLGLFDADDPGHLLYIMAGAFLGPDIGPRFNKFILERERQVKAEEVLDNWKKAKKRLQKGTKNKQISNEQYIELVNKLGDFLKENVITDAQAKQYAEFMHDLPPEPCMVAWSFLQKKQENLFAVHPYVNKLIVARATGKDVSKLKGSQGSKAAASKQDDKTTQAPAPRKRGKRR